MNKLLIIILSICFTKISLCQQIDSTNIANNDSLPSDSIIQLILQTGSYYLNTPYRYSGTNENGLDCSGFICAAYIGANITLPHSSTEISKKGSYVSADNLQVGDLIFFKGRSSNSIGHVAMVSKIKDGLIYIMHATNSRGVIEEILQYSKYFNDRWLFNKRILDVSSK